MAHEWIIIFVRLQVIYFLYSDCNSSFTLFFALKRRFKKAYIFFYHYDIGTTLGEMLDFPSLGNLSISGDYTLWVNKLLHNGIFKFIARHSLIFFIVKTLVFWSHGISLTYWRMQNILGTVSSQSVSFTWNYRYFTAIYVISKNNCQKSFFKPIEVCKIYFIYIDNGY